MFWMAAMIALIAPQATAPKAQHTTPTLPPIAAIPQASEPKVLQHFPEGWDVYEDDDGCSLASDYGNGTIVALRYYLGDSYLNVFNTSLDWTKDEELYHYRLLTIDLEGQNKFVGNIVVKGLAGKGKIGGGLSVRMTTDHLDLILRGNSALAIFNGHTQITAFSLDKIGPPLDAVRACATRYEKAHEVPGIIAPPLPPGPDSNF